MGEITTSYAFASDTNNIFKFKYALIQTHHLFVQGQRTRPNTSPLFHTFNERKRTAVIDIVVSLFEQRRIRVRL